jgi:hypothetical protein
MAEVGGECLRARDRLQLRCLPLSLRSWLPRRRVLALAIGSSLVLACAAERQGPEQALAESTLAQREYRNLRARWFAASAKDRAALAPEIRRFVARHAFDDRARSAGIFLAWIEIDQNDLGTARSLLGGGGQSRRANDYATITDAAIATRSGNPERALALLEPLAGKIVDPDERVVHGEERVRALLAAQRFERSVHAMLDWLLEAPPDRFEPARAQVAQLLRRVPTADALAALQAQDRVLQQGNGSTEAMAVRRWLTKSLYTELTRRALEATDGLLARTLLPLAPASLRGSADHAALARLSSQGSSAPRIAGRAVGLFLSVGSDDARRRAAALAAGVSRGLESAAPRVQLLMRDDAGAPERTTSALASLASDGAAILIAGTDDEAARQASIFAERARIPLLLVRDVKSEDPRRYTFVLAAPEAEQLALLEKVLGERGRSELARVGGPELSCATPPAFAGQARFPLEAWKKQRVDGVIVAGPAGCARDVARELGAAGSKALAACTLECAETALGNGGPALAVKAGSFPNRGDWYEALGRDAAALARAALADFPEERVVDRALVGELHARARGALERAEVTLETSEARGFGGAQTLPRTLGVIDGAGNPRLKRQP